MSFEEVKQYFNENRQYYFSIGESYIPIDLKDFCSFAINDLNRKINGEEVQPSLGKGDMNYAAAFTLRIIYELVADELNNIDEFAEAWSELYSNYIKAFYPSYDKKTYIEGLINLLALKNNMARLIVLSNYIIFKKQNDTYTNVSDTFIQSIINNHKDDE